MGIIARYFILFLTYQLLLRTKMYFLRHLSIGILIKLRIGLPLTVMFIRRNIIFINVIEANISSNTRINQLEDHTETIKLLTNTIT